MSPTTSATGPVRHRRGAQGGRDDAVDAVGAAVRADGERAVRGREPGVEVAHRHGARRPTGRRRPGGRRRGPATDAPSNGSSSAASHASIAVVGGAVGRQPVGRPRRDRRARARARAGEAPGRGGGVGVDVGRGHQRGLAPAAVAVDDQRAPGVTRASSSTIGLDVGMAPVRRTRSGRWASSHGPGRASWSPRATTLRPVVAAGPQPRERVGEDREAGRARRARRGRREAPGRRPGRRRSGRARAPARRAGERVERPRRRGFGGPRDDRGERPRRPAPASPSAGAAERPVGQQRLAERDVDLDRARRALGRHRDRPARRPSASARAWRRPPSSSGSSANHFADRP